jgi:hypothetical protein
MQIYQYQGLAQPHSLLPAVATEGDENPNWLLHTCSASQMLSFYVDLRCFGKGVVVIDQSERSMHTR